MNRFFNKVQKLFQSSSWLVIDLWCTRKQRILVSECEWDESLLRFQRLFKHEFIRKDFKSLHSFDGFDWVIPITSEAYRDLKPELQKHEKLLSPKPEVFNTCDNKGALQATLIKLGYQRLLPLRSEGYFPCILKPVDSCNSDGIKLIHKQSELDQHHETIEQQGYVLQNYIPGKVEVASHILIRNGEIIHAQAVEFHYLSESFISVQQCPIIRRLVQDPFLDLWQRLLVDIDYEGICCIDYKPSGGVPFLIEINPRIGGSFREYAFSMIWPLQRGSGTYR